MPQQIRVTCASCSGTNLFDISNTRDYTCPQCGVTTHTLRDTASANVIPCATHYVEYRGYSQEVDTVHYEHVTDPNRRFSARFKHTPLDAQFAEVWGHSPSDVIARVKETIESAAWDVHYRGIMDRIDGMQATIDKLTAQLPPSSSPAADPSLPAAASAAQ